MKHMIWNIVTLYFIVRCVAFRGQVLKRSWKLKNTVNDFLQEKNKLPEERDLSCHNNWLFDFAFLVGVTSNINDLNLKQQGKNKLFPSLVNDINAFKMKLKMSVSQLEDEDLCQFPHLKGQSECAAGVHGGLA